MRVSGVLLVLLVTGCQKPPVPISPSRPPAEAIDLLNKPAPAFSAERIDRPGTLSVPNGRVTLVIFTGGWSGGSKRALHRIEEAHRRFADLEIAAIAMDETADDGRSFAESCSATFPVGHDRWGKRLAWAWAQDPYVPNTVFLLDRQGVVRYVGRGGKDGWYPEVERQIPIEVEKLLAAR